MEEKVIKIPFRRLFGAILLSLFLSGFILFVLFFVGIIGGFSLFGDDVEGVKSNTILHMRLGGTISENAVTEIDPLSVSVLSSKGLSAILFGLKQASEDDRIRGLFLDFGDINCGIATAQEIREGLEQFKKSKKFIVAYNSGEYVSQKAYYLASVADEVYGFPSSVFQWTGLGGEVFFIKELMAKLGLEVAILKGNNNDFKSAVEPLFLNSISDSSRLQMDTYLNSTWSTMLHDISSSRSIPEEKLDVLAEEMSIKNVKDAVEYQLMDSSMYIDQVYDLLMKKVQVSDRADLNLYSFSTYSESEFMDDQLLANSGDPSVAVILAEGSISKNGEGFTSEKICQYFREVREIKSIKSVVFRVNSPGGSALASEEIWREVYLTNKVKKVVVSMGDYAASGGYYVATPAHMIFADKSTITGSIGVFGVLPYTKKMLGKIGVEVEGIGTNTHSILSTNRKLTDAEFKMAQAEVNAIYEQFLERVGTGRKMTRDQVQRVARGRVWTGEDALDIGLVDRIGSLQSAISYAQKLIKSSENQVVYYPEVKENPLTLLLEMVNNEKLNTKSGISILQHPVLRSLENKLETISEWEGNVMRLPYQFDMR
ncbi:MAG: signal peptide peptidase SppA [Crocinitomicaceae bacterium]